MPATSQKNMPLGGAATDLGLGDMLGQQVQDETEDERRKRMALMQQAKGGGAAGGAASALLGGSLGFGA